MDTKIPAGWHQVPDYAAANPEQKPADAVCLVANGPRLADAKRSWRTAA